MKSTKKKSLILIKINEFFSSREKKNIFLNKKMFAIYPDEKNKPKSVHYFSVQEASEKTGFPPKEIEKALQSPYGRYFCPKDKKVFRVRDLSSGGKFVRIGEELFPDVNSIMKKFGMERDDVIYQLCNNSNQDFFPPDSLSEPMQKYMPLSRLIDAWKNARKLEQTLSFLPPSHIQEKAKDLVEEIEKLF